MRGRLPVVGPPLVKVVAQRRFLAQAIGPCATRSFDYRSRNARMPDGGRCRRRRDSADLGEKKSGRSRESRQPRPTRWQRGIGRQEAGELVTSPFTTLSKRNQEDRISTLESVAAPVLPPILNHRDSAAFAATRPGCRQGYGSAAPHPARHPSPASLAQAGSSPPDESAWGEGLSM